MISAITGTVRGDTARLVGAAATSAALTALTIWIWRYQPAQPKGHRAA